MPTTNNIEREMVSVGDQFFFEKHHIGMNYDFDIIDKAEISTTS